MSSSDGNNSSKDSESEDEGEDGEFNQQQVKLAQMKRNARNKGTTSKLIQKYKNIMTPEERLKMETIKRIEAGIRSILVLHTPIELSSMCGSLGLKPLERASHSIDQLVNFCKDGGEDFSEAKVAMCVNVMWESAIFEYLKSIGVPMMTCFPDPKQALMKIWRKGGFGEIPGAFTPHYVVKRILTRFDEDVALDISSRLAKLKQMELSLKVTEREVYEDHDYSNILHYFQKLNNLRTFETESRDYFVTELEKTRSEISRSASNAKWAHQMLLELEERFIFVTDYLNQQIALYETSHENEMKSRFVMDSMLVRLRSVLTSVLEEQQGLNNTPYHAGDVVPSSAYIARRMHRTKDMHPEIVDMHNTLMALRTKIRVDEGNFQAQITQLENDVASRDDHIRKLEEEKMNMQREIDRLKNVQQKNEIEIKYCAKKLVTMKVEGDAVRHAAWTSLLQAGVKKAEINNKIELLKPIIRQGVLSSSYEASKMCLHVNQIFGFLSREVAMQFREIAAMQAEDLPSCKYISDMIETESTAPKKKGKKGKKAKGGKKGKLDGGKSTTTAASSKKEEKGSSPKKSPAKKKK
jgi:hypothetical protein